MIRHVSLGIVSALCLCAAPAYASTMTVSFSSGEHSAMAEFTFSDAGGGNANLSITLTNTMASESTVDARWLTGLYFDINGSPDLSVSGVDADLRWGDENNSNTIDYTAAQFWAFRGDIASGELPFGSQQYGLSAVGAGVFNGDDMIELGGPHPQPNGPDGGVLADGASSPNGHDNRLFMDGSVTFDFFLAGFDYNDGVISNVAFHFGSSFDEVILLIPLPAPVGMGLLGLLGVAVARRRLA